MTNNPKIALVCLSFNEVEGLKELLPKVSNPEACNVDEIFAVDGGSTDGSLDLYEKYGVKVLNQTSRGRGEAMRLAAQSTDAECLIFFSPDGNEDYKDISKFRQFFQEGHDLVIASRMMKGARNEEDEQLVRLRKWANKAFNLAANFFFRKAGPYVTDSINGFRGMRRTWLLNLNTDAVGYTIEFQMTMRALQERQKIIEFPTVEGNRIGGESKALAVPTGLRFLKCLWREIYSHWFKAKRSSIAR